MGPHMVGQLTFVGERRPADVALRRFLAVRHFDVNLHALLRGEQLAAHLTRHGLLSAHLCYRLNVYVQMRL